MGGGLLERVSPLLIVLEVINEKIDSVVVLDDCGKFLFFNS